MKLLVTFATSTPLQLKITVPKKWRSQPISAKLLAFALEQYSARRPQQLARARLVKDGVALAADAVVGAALKSGDEARAGARRFLGARRGEPSTSSGASRRALPRRAVLRRERSSTRFLRRTPSRRASLGSTRWS